MSDLSRKSAETYISIVDKDSQNVAAVTSSNQLKVLSTLSGTTGSVKSQAVTVTTTAGKVPLTPLTGRNTLTLQNLGPKDIYVGDATVTSTSGLLVASGGTLTLDISDAVDLYALTSVSTSDVRVFETS